MMFPSHLLGLISLVILLFITLVTAEITNSFANLSYGSTVRLTWDTIPPESYPLFITAQLIDKGENGDDNGNGNGGGTVTAYKMNITTAIDSSSGNAFEWTGIPSPLRWLPEGLYQIELHGSGSVDGTATPLAKSPFFAVGQPPYASGTEGNNKPASSSGDEACFLFPSTSGSAPYRRGNSADLKNPEEQPTQSGDSGDEHSSGANKRLAFGLGFAIGIPSVVGLSLVSWCLWKRRQRVLDEKREEERRARRRDFVID